MRRTVLLLAVFLVAGCGSPEQRAQNYYERGMQLLSKQDYVKAGIEFKNAVQNKKDMVGAWRGLARDRIAQSKLPRRRFQFCVRLWNLIQKTSNSKLKLGHYLLVGNAWIKPSIWPMPRSRSMAEIRMLLRSKRPYC